MQFVVRHHGGGSHLECPWCGATERLHVTSQAEWLEAVRGFLAKHRH